MTKKLLCILIFILFIGASILPSITSCSGGIDKKEIMDYKILIKQFIKSGVVSNDDWLEQAKLLASDGEERDQFGRCVSIDGDTALIGVPNGDNNGEETGSAYVFTRSGNSWTQQAKLLASDGAAGDDFGYSVSLDGDTAIIGAYHDDDYGENSGSAYIFTRDGTTWDQQAKLLPLDETFRFGECVSIDGDYVIIGNQFNDENGWNSGSAYIFTGNGSSWTQQAKLLASDGEAEDYFGISVSIDGETVIIGAYTDNDNGNYSGSAYIFTRSGSSWTQQAKLLASDGAPYDYFGWSTSIDNNTAIIGAFEDDDNEENSGSVYIFTRSGSSWKQQAKLLASDGEERDWFGYSVSIEGDTALIGAHEGDYYEQHSGVAYIFNRSGSSWTQEAKLHASDYAAGDHFGFSTSISGDSVIIGAWADDDYGSSSGSAYIFIEEGENYPPSAPTINGPIKGKPNVQYTFAFHSSDPEGGDVRYHIDWGDETSEVTGWYPSCTPKVVNHTYVSSGNYVIIAYAEDEDGNVGPDSSYLFVVPRDKAVTNNLFLQRLLDRFPLLQRLSFVWRSMVV
jgi:predicted amidohydrolase